MSAGVGPGAGGTLGRLVAELSARAAAVDGAAVEGLLDEVVGARRVFVAGAGRSGLVARAFANRLMHLGLTAHVLGDVTTPAIGAGDVLLAVSNSGATGGVAAAARTAVAAGARVLLVTGATESPTAALSSSVVLLPADGSVGVPGDEPLAAPMGTLFEGLAFLVLEAAALDLQARLGATETEMRERHANLE